MLYNIVMRKFLLFCLVGLSTSLFSQTTWQKLSATKASDWGLSYSLPKTVFCFDTEYTKTTLIAGQYYKYAERLLGIKEPIRADSVYYTLDKVSILPTATVDKNSASMVQFKSIVPYIVLNEEGILCSVNTLPDTTINYKLKPLPANYLLTQEDFDSHLALSEETLASGSLGKMAEMAAKQIFRIRESRMDLLSGDADSRPKDGAGIQLILDQLDKQERALTALFTGTVKREKMFVRNRFNPTDIELSHFVLYRFSKHYGVVPADDLSGDPVYLDIRATDKKDYLPVDPKKKFVKPGLVYLVPGRGIVKLSNASGTIVEGEYFLTQFGIQVSFDPELFTRKKSPAQVVLNPETGAIMSLKQ